MERKPVAAQLAVRDPIRDRFRVRAAPHERAPSGRGAAQPDLSPAESSQGVSLSQYLRGPEPLLRGAAALAAASSSVGGGGGGGAGGGGEGREEGGDSGAGPGGIGRGQVRAPRPAGSREAGPAGLRDAPPAAATTAPPPTTQLPHYNYR